MWIKVICLIKRRRKNDICINKLQKQCKYVMLSSRAEMGEPKQMPFNTAPLDHLRSFDFGVILTN